jgi:hypothetical protein
MKKIIGMLHLVLVFSTAAALAAETGISSTTMLGFNERSVPGFQDEFRAPLNQFLTINAADSDEKLSLNLYGWGRLQLQDPGSGGDGDLTTGFLNYRFPKSNAFLRAGRFYEFQITGIEQVDGVSARTDLGKYFGISVFGGAPVRTEFDTKGDFIYGGKITMKVPRYLEVGVSALREEGAVTFTRDSIKDARELVGGNIFLSPHQIIDFHANASYNLATEGVQEQRYLINLRPMDMVQVSADYRDYRYEDYFASTNMPWLFSPDPDGKLRSVGGNINLRPLKPFELTLLYRHYRKAEPEVAQFDRYGVQTRYFAKPFTTGFHYYRVDGDDKELRYHEVYAFGETRVGKTTANLNVSTHVYDEKIYNESLDLRIGASLGYEVTKELKLTGGLSYGRNPHVNDDVTGTIWLTYNPKI